VDHLGREQLAAEAALALRRGQHVVLEMALERVERRPGRVGCGP
jgi:hypothetical protein